MNYNKFFRHPKVQHPSVKDYMEWRAWELFFISTHADELFMKYDSQTLGWKTQLLWMNKP